MADAASVGPDAAADGPDAASVGTDAADGADAGSIRHVIKV